MYAVLALSVFFADTLRTIYFFIFTIRISDHIHGEMLRNMINASMKFFNRNPTGFTF